MYKLNEQQQLAVNSDSQRILCLACAGAGKTHVLISRICRLVETGVNPDHILCITFTNAAALEMEERYKARVGKVGKVPEFRTFHSFCYSILSRNPQVRNAIGYSYTPSIANDAMQKKVEQMAMLQCGLKFSSNDIQNPKELKAKDKTKYEIFYKAYRRQLAKNNLITFDILLEEICKLFYTNDVSILGYKNRYKHIFVDEFQDTDAIQIKFLNSFPNTSFFFVGDALQNLYSFRGTSNEYIKMLSENDDWEKIRMSQNYRSTKQICEYANDHSHYAKDSYRIPLESNREGVRVDEIEDSDFNFDRRYPITEMCIEKIAEELKSEEMDTAILCRTNAEVSYLQEQLKDYGIATHSDKKKDYVHSILKSAIDDEYFVNWMSVVLNSHAYSNYLMLSAGEEKVTSEWFIKNFGKYPQVCEAANQVFDVRHLIATTKSVDELNEKISDMFDLDQDIFEDCENKYEAIVDAIKTLDAAEVSGIYCGTIHSVKGLEFDRVIIVNAGNPTFGLLGKGEENKNIFYVAITRAKQKLIVFRGYVK